MAHDFHGAPYVTGFTDSPDFPIHSALQNANAGGMDAFVVKMNATLSAEAFGTYIGGSGSASSANAIAVDFGNLSGHWRSNRFRRFPRRRELSELGVGSPVRLRH